MLEKVIEIRWGIPSRFVKPLRDASARYSFIFIDLQKRVLASAESISLLPCARSSRFHLAINSAKEYRTRAAKGWRDSRAIHHTHRNSWPTTVHPLRRLLSLRRNVSATLSLSIARRVIPRNHASNTYATMIARHVKTLGVTVKATRPAPSKIEARPSIPASPPGGDPMHARIWKCAHRASRESAVRATRNVLWSRRQDECLENWFSDEK